MSAAPNPLGDYTARLFERNAQAARLDRQSATISNLRLLVFAAFGVVLWLVLRGTFPWWWLALPLAAFAALVAWHEKVIQALTRKQRAGGFYARGISRIEDRWKDGGRTGEQFRDPEHVYAEDLDLFGRGSLFQLLSTARTHMGEGALARWLLSPASVTEIRRRHSAIDQLRTKLDFREDLATTGDEISPDFDPTTILAWAEGPVLLRNKAVRVVAPTLALVAVAAIVVAIAKSTYWPIAAIIFINSFFYIHYRTRMMTVLATVEGAAEPLELFASLVRRIEREPLDGGLLSDLKNRLQTAGSTASRALSSFSSLITFVDSRENVVFKILDVPLLYSLQVAFAVEAWRDRHGRNIRGWLESIGELEALNSLAAFAYEHPTGVFPELVESPIPQFHGESLAHPLIPFTKVVRNSISLDAQPRVLLVSGSNMSGKSTLLRTVGVNTVLAMAGATVRAQSLRLTPLQLGSSLHVVDSLQTGRSGFASELYRLRQIMSLMDQQSPVLFLVDELLHGTNSRDRHIGGLALLRAFISKGAIGLATTHDLSLTQVAPDLQAFVRNAHFEDRVVDGQMKFDYVLRDGVVTKSNALELMRSIGLDV